MLRGALVAIIHARSLELTESGHDDLAAITLMSTDVDIICDKVSAIYEVWAQFIEVGVGIWLLVRQLGWVAVVPLLIIVGPYSSNSIPNRILLMIITACSRIAPRIGIISRVRQKVWTAAVQQRIAMTSSMLSSMKSLKMMGLSDEIYENIQSQRIKEMEFVKRFRWMIVLLNAIGLYRSLYKMAS
jgi:ATP-binding cassette subfamily C (CFTR/MRP) protein 1